MEWITGNWDTIVGVIAGVIGLASIVTGLTKTSTDDTVLSVVKTILRQVGMLKHEDEAGTLKLPLVK